jgi:hypothetical protein
MLRRLSLILALACSVPAYGQDSFTKSLSPADFQAAGLGKLTPAELAALDALVQGRQTGAVAKAKEETKVETTKVVTEQVRQQVTQQITQQVTQQVTQKVTQQVKAEDQQAEIRKPVTAKIIDELKVVLKPGTQIEYTTLDAEIVPPFDGWSKGTVITLTNGQRWVVTDENQYWTPKSKKPVHARIEPGALGSFFMEIDGAARPRVRFLDNIAAAAPAPP